MMETKTQAMWVIAKKHDDGTERLMWYDKVLGFDEEEAMRPALRRLEHNNPELKGKLRIVPVIVTIEEMPADKAEAWRERRRRQGEEMMNGL
jgi:hypothetical protein